MERRVLLFFVLSFLVIIGMQTINSKLFPPPPRPHVTLPAPGATPSPSPTAATSQTLASATPTPAPKPAAPVMTRQQARKVALATKVFDVEISLKGAVPIRWDLIDEDYVVPPPGQSKAQARKAGKLREALIDPDLAAYDQLPHPFETVLQDSSGAYYSNFNSDLYQEEKITSGSLTGYRFTSPPGANGLRMVKSFLLNPAAKGFSGRFDVQLVNDGKYTIAFDRTGLGVIVGPGLGKVPENFQRNTTVDPSIKAPDTVFYKKPSKPGSMEEFPGSEIEWGGLESLYFLQALVPLPPTTLAKARVVLDSNLVGTIATDATSRFYPGVELYSKPFTIQPGQRLDFSYNFFFGPKQRQILQAAGHGLDRAMFFTSWNWIRALCIGMMGLLVWLQSWLLNWGVAIIVLTVIVRVVSFPLVQKGMKSQAKMMAEQARIKPLMDKINEKYKNDPQRKQQEIFKLYKEHGVNPFGAFKGCIWLIIQMPIFIALYIVINQSIVLRGAHFLWILDLAQPDHFFKLPFTLPLLGTEYINLLPLVMGATQILTSKVSMTQTSTDPQQEQMQKMMTWFMPIFMIFIFYGMPSGLVLYWTVSNVWQVAQQLWVNKHIKKPQPAASSVPAPKKA